MQPHRQNVQIEPLDDEFVEVSDPNTVEQKLQTEWLLIYVWSAHNCGGSYLLNYTLHTHVLLHLVNVQRHHRWYTSIGPATGHLEAHIFQKTYQKVVGHRINRLVEGIISSVIGGLIDFCDDK